MLKALISTSFILLLVVPSEGQSVTVRPEKPINCEDFQAHLDHVIIEWQKLEGTYLILIARLGTGERDKQLNRARLDYVEPYLKTRNVRYLRTEGDRVKGLGRLEVYVGGRLAMSIPIQKGANRLCFGDTG